MKWISALVSIVLSFNVFASVEQYVRFEQQGEIQYGKLSNNQIYPISGDLFAEHQISNQSIPLDSVTLLLPTEPEKVFAVGMNFASHLASSSSAPPPLFLKLPTSLILSGETILVPKDAKNLHFEGEMVLVIGKMAKEVSLDDASDTSGV
ncbi:oxaloacetate decarboxylase [Vibrio ishigakensis]|uniref:Oxaloacetate decarboxylase n=1 Tax=Vibrio ishigakensis TaxID=1481914 RepID=A0A0B8PM97_9VIBR|nr:oxaloacetate decarboxylase [Vibrio ishigakensis]